MSTFRPPQVPQQPRQNFTPGQPRGIPKPLVWGQQAAYQRDRVEREFLQFQFRPLATAGQPLGTPLPRTDYQTAAYARDRREPTRPSLFAVIPPAASFVPSRAMQLPDRVRGVYAEALFAATEPSFTTGQPLGVPQRVQGTQVAAYWRGPAQVPLQITYNATVGTALGVPAPRQDSQQNSYWRPREQAEAAQLAARAVAVPFTPGLALGAPNPAQTDQTQAAWRARIEIQQPLTFAPQPSPPVFVPSAPVQLTAAVPPTSVAILSQALSYGATVGLPLGTPTPVQSDQRQATWRPVPQVPWQVPINATAGLASGTPNPAQSDQTQALWRARVEIQQPASYAVQPAAPSWFPSLPLQIPAPVAPTSLAALSQALSSGATTGLPLGIPVPYAPLPAAALWRARVEVLQLPNYAPPTPVAVQVPPVALQPVYASRPVVEPLLVALAIPYTPGFALGVPMPQQGDQSAAYRRPREQLEAAELAAGLVDVPFTPALALGVPTARQGDQTPALWRAHIEILQPAQYAIIPAPSAQVPLLPLQSVPSNRWPIEWLTGVQSMLATSGQPLGTPLPLQSSQVQAMWRPRVDIQQPQVLAPPQTPSSYVPPATWPTIVPVRWALEWITTGYPISFTQGLTLGIPVPRQPDQLAALWRSRPEIAPPTLYAVPAAPSAVVPPLPLQQLPAARWALEWVVEAYGVEFAQGLPLGVPLARQSDQAPALWRQRIELQQPPSFVVQPAPPANVPPLALQTSAPNNWRFEWLIDFLQPEFVPPPTLAVPPLILAVIQQPSWRYEWLVDFLAPEFVPQPPAYVAPAALARIETARVGFEWYVQLQARTPLSAAQFVVDPRYVMRRGYLRSFYVWPTSLYLMHRLPIRAFSASAASRNLMTSRLVGRNFTRTTVSNRRFDTKDPTEKVILTFDFTNDLPSGVTLSGSPTVVATTTLGTDASPSAILNGAASLDGTSKMVLVPVQGGLDGCEYRVSAQCATTNALLKFELDAVLPVRS